MANEVNAPVIVPGSDVEQPPPVTPDPAAPPPAAGTGKGAELSQTSQPLTMDNVRSLFDEGVAGIKQEFGERFKLIEGRLGQPPQAEGRAHGQASDERKSIFRAALKSRSQQATERGQRETKRNEWREQRASRRKSGRIRLFPD